MGVIACANCGSKVNDEWKICPECGAEPRSGIVPESQRTPGLNPRMVAVPSRPSAVGIVVTGVLAGVCLAFLLWTRSAASLQYGHSTGRILKPDYALVFYVISIVGLIGFSIGFTLLLVRYLKASPASQGAGLPPGASSSVAATATPHAPVQYAAQTLQTLAALRGQGVISDEEFEARKGALLDQMVPAPPVASAEPPRSSPANTAFCSQCGRPIADGMRFCAGCGRPVAEVSSPGA